MYKKIFWAIFIFSLCFVLSSSAQERPLTKHISRKIVFYPEENHPAINSPGELREFFVDGGVKDNMHYYFTGKRYLVNEKEVYWEKNWVREPDGVSWGGEIVSTEIRGQRPDGLYKIYFPGDNPANNGKVEEEHRYKDGKENGHYRRFWNSGKIRSEGDYKDGELDRLCLTYYESGQVESATRYKNGKLIPDSFSCEGTYGGNGVRDYKEESFRVILDVPRGVDYDDLSVFFDTESGQSGVGYRIGFKANQWILQKRFSDQSGVREVEIARGLVELANQNDFRFRVSVPMDKIEGEVVRCRNSSN